MRNSVHAVSLEETHYLQPDLFTGNRQTKRDEEMGWDQSTEELSELREGVSIPATETDLMQSELRESPRMEEEIRRAMSDRTKRLRVLGNSVVPQVAEWVGRRILDFERYRFDVDYVCRGCGRRFWPHERHDFAACADQAGTGTGTGTGMTVPGERTAR
jgi:hypothetical protein